jgi:hypothetical protein
MTRPSTRWRLFDVLSVLVYVACVAIAVLDIFVFRP